ncbi:MAG: DUF1036 domain-containing protein [Leptolyngbyaceae cyanobacterium]
MKKMQAKLLLFFCTLIPLTFWESKALADWRICNNTGYDVTIAIGYSDDGEWVSKGWWEIGSGGRCMTLIHGDLQNRYYYYYAEHNDIGGSWSGDYYFCVSSNAFLIVGDENCQSRGYRAQGFAQVDTGPTARSWTTNLVD